MLFFLFVHQQLYSDFTRPLYISDSLRASFSCVGLFPLSNLLSLTLITSLHFTILLAYFNVNYLKLTLFSNHIRLL